ncbi:PREDICTED: mucin-2-like [Nicotiana attenuata]|uniref:mucin-2-like n=1 Tax=Nicotiana attenuata TaxID=49451 RepID=UPI000905C05D|nr:PREDICTED: mucin-2-like [Nicotiana attenuata]
MATTLPTFKDTLNPTPPKNVEIPKTHNNSINIGTTQSPQQDTKSPQSKSTTLSPNKITNSPTPIIPSPSKTFQPCMSTSTKALNRTHKPIFPRQPNIPSNLNQTFTTSSITPTMLVATDNTDVPPKGTVKALISALKDNAKDIPLSNLDESKNSIPTLQYLPYSMQTHVKKPIELLRIRHLKTKSKSTTTPQHLVHSNAIRLLPLTPSPSVPSETITTQIKTTTQNASQQKVLPEPTSTSNEPTTTTSNTQPTCLGPMHSTSTTMHVPASSHAAREQHHHTIPSSTALPQLLPIARKPNNGIINNNWNGQNLIYLTPTLPPEVQPYNMNTSEMLQAYQSLIYNHTVQEEELLIPGNMLKQSSNTQPQNFNLHSFPLSTLQTCRSIKSYMHYTHPSHQRKCSR